MNARSEPAMIAPGEHIDGFTVGALRHTGAQGAIYDVAGPGTVPLIMKVPRIDPGTEQAEALIAYEVETMIMPELRGRHVPRFVAAGDLATTPYIVMERIEGTGLAALAPPLDVESVTRLGAAIADALHDVHRQDTIHLDLKPDNIIVRPDGSVVLIDFGLAHHARLPDLLAEEQRFAAGSSPYISPEQVQGNRTDPRSDVFALGVILYELATGALPYGTPETIAGMRDRLWLDPEPPASRNRAVPAWLQEVILRCLEADATKRYQSAAHVAFDLRNPQQIVITERGTRAKSARLGTRVRRWFGTRSERRTAAPTPNAHLAATPIVMIAVDTEHPEDPRQPAIQRAARRLLGLSAELRVICVSVVGAPAPGDPGGANLHLEHLVRLRHWSRPLGLPPARLTLHVIEAAGATDALVRFARDNHVDLIILGAPEADERALAWWRSVASGVTANAPCSVHVVRAGHADLYRASGA